jgi:hypothetical protein
VTKALQCLATPTSFTALQIRSNFPSKCLLRRDKILEFFFLKKEQKKGNIPTYQDTARCALNLKPWPSSGSFLFAEPEFLVPGRRLVPYRIPSQTQYK